MSLSSDRVCRLCGTDVDLKMCKRCEAAWYCSVDHQKRDYKRHKDLCKSIAHSQPSSINVFGANSRNCDSNYYRPSTAYGHSRSVLQERVNPQLSSDLPMQLQGSSIGNGGAQRGMIPNHMPMNPLEASNSSSEPPSKHHGLVQLEIDNHLSEEEDSSYQLTLHSLIEHLNEYGVCVLDGFLADDVAEQILGEVETLHDRGEFQDGQVMSRNIQDQSRRIIRGDKITWVTGNEHNCKSIGHLVSKVDRLVGQANRHQEARKLARYDIKWRTLAMVACYPGRGSHYVKHVDNPDGDGRCITAIYYLNRNWQPEDGGVLRIMPVGSGQVANIDPIFNRMLFFWSDRRNPHEVLPAHCTRYAITLWYHDQREREEYLARMAS